MSEPTREPALAPARQLLTPVTRAHAPRSYSGFGLVIAALGLSATVLGFSIGYLAGDARSGYRESTVEVRTGPLSSGAPRIIHRTIETRNVPAGEGRGSCGHAGASHVR